MIDCKYLELVALIQVRTALCLDNLCQSDKTFSKETSKSDGITASRVQTPELYINLSSQLCRTSDDVTKELMVPFLFTRGVLSGQRFDVLPPFLGVSFSQIIHFFVIIRALRCFNSAMDSILPEPIYW